MPRAKYNVVSLFSGAMGLDVGLGQTNRFRVLACVENNPTFCETIRRNRDGGRLDRRLKVFEANVEDLHPLDVLKSIGMKPGQVDLLVGGPPCQSFSTAGKRRTTRDKRGNLLWEYLRFVSFMQPRFFLMENVRGLLSAALRHRPIAQRPQKGGPPLGLDEEPGSVVRLFAKTLQRAPDKPYHMDCFEVNAVNYGAPQIRERALFIGNRFNAQVDLPDPTHGPSGRSNGLAPWRTLGDAIAGLREKSPIIMDFSPRKKKYLAMVPAGSNWRSMPTRVQKQSLGKAWYAKGGRSGWWRRLSFDLPCPTLVTMPNHASTSLSHPTEVRALTLREYARVQEFPDAWEFCGTPAQQYEQVGNAVPIGLGNLAGEVIADHLDDLRKRRWRPYAKRPTSYRVIYIGAHVRTRQWYKAGKTFVRRDGGVSDGTSYGPAKTHRKASLLVPS